MSSSTHLYGQVLASLRQSSPRCDPRLLKTLAWMVSALLCSERLSLPTWEAYVPSRAQKAQSDERRWQRFLGNARVWGQGLYLPLVMVVLRGWQSHRVYLALDTSVLWDQYCLVMLSVVCCGRAVPLVWRVLEHGSATVAFVEYQGLLQVAHRWLSSHPQVMLLADRGFANHELLAWVQQQGWHYGVRLPCDVLVHGPRSSPRAVGSLYPPVGQAQVYHQVRLWADGTQHCNLVLATVKGAKDSWAVVTDLPPSLQTLWQYALRFRVEELFLDSKSGVFELEQSRVRSPQALERLYLVTAIALLVATTQGMAVQIAGLRRCVDPHWRRGLSYLKIGLRWLQGVLHKERLLFPPAPLLPTDPQPCFASNKAENDFYEQFWFSRIRSLNCLSA